ncbi:MAG: hypothetical protein U5L95_03180 [Candidatus Saccharibacteria bacterium]|nr:hypothetical protein [Candidatus Saccharibacteria bacterium]
MPPDTHKLHHHLLLTGFLIAFGVVGMFGLQTNFAADSTLLSPEDALNRSDVVVPDSDTISDQSGAVDRTYDLRNFMTTEYDTQSGNGVYPVRLGNNNAMTLRRQKKTTTHPGGRYRGETKYQIIRINHTRSSRDFRIGSGYFRAQVRRHLPLFEKVGDVT